MEKCLHPSTYQFKIETFGVILKDSEILEPVCYDEDFFSFRAAFKFFTSFGIAQKILAERHVKS